ncbi:MAG: AAA family ATPase, partial [Clostridiales bacterium]|nr:AAA family ATPase [Clostridiales bacterium]
DMAIDQKLILKRTEDRTQVYAASYYYMEANVAAMLRELNVRYDGSETEMESRIGKLESLSEIELDELQRVAVKEAVRNGLLVITGGPGTGKTTTINTIIRYFESEGMDICLAAPTGRAAKRMSEATGFEAKTIHRMLELSGGVEARAGFERNEKNPLETDVIIIDEVSMVDITLMYALLKAVVAGTRLILVGDANQLPSVGPGCVLQDIIEAHACNVVRLNHIFRQASQSDIVVNAHKINRGEAVTLDNRSRDFFFLKRTDANVIISVCIQLIREKLPGYVHARPFDIQMLTPMRKGLLGVERLNGILQEYLNPPVPGREEKAHGDAVFRVGDKVMQTKNNYQAEWEIVNRYGIPIEKGLGVFNGDMGIIREINSFAESLTVEFEEGRMVEYPFKQLDELELAYAITIHKAQGSEYPAVVIPLLGGPRMLMNRNLLYTAVTRARKCVTLVGDDRTFFHMIENVNEQKRYSGLRDRLEEAG